jgi:hypothetical protein
MYSSVKTLQSPKGDVEVFIDFCPSWIFFYRKFQQIPRILLTKFDHFEVSWTGNNFEWKSIRDRSGLLNSRGSQMFSNFVGEWAKGTKDQAEMNQLVVSKWIFIWLSIWSLRLFITSSSSRLHFVCVYRTSSELPYIPCLKVISMDRIQ